jgi:hypothetical protein
MLIQWCVKGLALDSDDQATAIIDSRRGLICNWWRTVEHISPAERRDKLTTANLDLHVNHYNSTDPTTGEPFSANSPFISLTAGTVERDTAAKTNQVHSAVQTALWFGTQFGTRTTAYLFTCWVIVGPRIAVDVEGVAEEIRDLNTYRRYSDYQTEGEVVAKIAIPDNHIRECEKWIWDRETLTIKHAWTQTNPRFTRPETLSNVRELI